MKPYFLAFLMLAGIGSLLISARKPLPAPTAPIPWISIEEAAGKLRQQPKPILIDLYTTWCG